MKKSLLTLTFIGLLATAAACGHKDYVTEDDPMAEQEAAIAQVDDSGTADDNSQGTEDNFGANDNLGTSGNDDGNGTGYVCTDSGCAGYGDLSGL